MAGDQVIAARVYSAYRSAIQNSDEATGPLADAIATLPKWTDLPDKGRPWFAVCNAIEEFVATPKTREPFDYELSVPVPPRRIADEFVDADGKAPATNEVLPETLPETLRIRPIVAGDLCVPEHGMGTAAFNHAMRAKIHGIDTKMLEWRIDAADAAAAFYLLNDATTNDAWSLMRSRFIEEGGEPLLPMGAELIGWQAAALELFRDEQEGYFLLRCRSEGLGTVKVGPLRVGHTRVYEDVAEEETEWDGRLEATAIATKTDVEVLRSGRVEDAVRLWSCVQELKKKANERALLLYAAQRSSPSTGGDGKTSTDSPSDSST